MYNTPVCAHTHKINLRWTVDLHTTAMYEKLLGGNNEIYIRKEDRRYLHDFRGHRDFLGKFLRQSKHFTYKNHRQAIRQCTSYMHICLHVLIQNIQ